MSRRVPLVVYGRAEAGFLKAMQGCFVIAYFCLKVGLSRPEGGDVGGDGVGEHVAGEVEWVADGGGVAEEEGEGGGGGGGVVGGEGRQERQWLHIIYWPTATPLTQFHHQHIPHRMPNEFQGSSIRWTNLRLSAEASLRPSLVHDFSCPSLMLALCQSDRILPAWNGSAKPTLEYCCAGGAYACDYV
jgi:hypothetical protein